MVLDGGDSNMSFSPFYFDQQGTGSSDGVVTNYTNASSVNAIAQAQACSVNSSGLATPLDVTSQSSVNNWIGYANVRIPASALGAVISSGRLKLYTNTNSYALGTALYVGTDGNPTSTVPSVGVNGFTSGDYCIFLGVLVPNEANPSEFDISLFTQVIGVL